MSLSSWCPSFAQKVLSIDGSEESPNLIVFFANDYHEFYPLEAKYRDSFTTGAALENAVFTSAKSKNHYQYIVCLGAQLSEDVYARMIIEANNIKSLEDFSAQFEGTDNHDDFIWSQAIRITPKTNKPIYKINEHFLDINLNPIWAALLPAKTPSPINKANNSRLKVSKKK